jgi:hypothetical protein
MLILALVVGGLTAYYLGVRAGLFAAVGSAATLLLATFYPKALLPVFVLHGFWVIGLWLVKTKIPALVKPKEPEKKGWEKELDRWKKRATWLWNSRK